MRQKKLFGMDEVIVCDKIPLSKARAMGEEVLSHVSEWLKRCEVVGSVRRQKEFCKDIDLVGVGSLENAFGTTFSHFQI